MPAFVKPIIKYEALDKLDVRVGTIEQVLEIESSDKLVKLVVNFGDHKRNILVGMKKERENPKEMMGEKSEGMLFDIGYADEVTPVVLAMPEKPVPDGTRAG